MSRKSLNSNIAEFVMLGLLVLMFVGTFVCWSAAPDRIPVHWNLQGEVDRWGGKFEGLMLLPLIAVGIYGLLKVIPLIDPKKENFAQFATAYDWIQLGTISLMAVIHAAILASVMGYTIPMNLVVSLAVGCLFLVIGKVMGKVQPNWFVGVRTPWTLSSKQSWQKTHQCAGWLFIAIGVATIATGLTASKYALLVMLVTTIGGTLWLVVYSYLVWRSDTDRVSAVASTSVADTESD